MSHFVLGKNASADGKVKVDVAKSVLQKAIRRGNGMLACMAAKAMTKVAKLPASPWSQLYTIAAEDVGLASCNAPMFVHACREREESACIAITGRARSRLNSEDRIAGFDGGSRKWLYHCARELAEGPHSRFACLAIPAADARLKKALEEGTRADEDQMADLLRAALENADFDAALLPMAYFLAKDDAATVTSAAFMEAAKAKGPLGERIAELDLLKGHNPPLYASLATAVVCFRELDSVRRLHPYRDALDDAWTAAVDAAEPLGAQHVKPWALDMHTKAGRDLGRGVQHFLEHGAAVVGERLEVKMATLRWANEGMHALLRWEGTKGAPRRQKRKAQLKELLNEPPAKRARTEKKAIPTESELFSEPLRAQLTTRRNAPDAFFAREKSTGRWVFVKSCFESRELPDVAVASNDLKTLLGHLAFVPEMRVDAVTREQDGFVPGRFPQNHREGFALVCKSFPDGVEVATLPSLGIRRPTDLKDSEWTPEMRNKFLLALAYRYCVKASDTCTSNLMILDDEIYSVDENNWFADRSGRWDGMLSRPVSPKNRGVIVDSLCESRGRLVDVLKEWKSKLPRAGEKILSKERKAEFIRRADFLAESASDRGAFRKLFF